MQIYEIHWRFESISSNYQTITYIELTLNIIFFLINGVKFDGVSRNFLKEAKSRYKNFVKNRDFYS